MSDFDLALRIQAAEQGRALPRLRLRHVAIHPDAHVLTCLVLAGEDTDIHVVLFGPLGARPHVGFVADPRRRADLFALYQTLATWVSTYLDQCRQRGTYPQIWVASAAAARHLGALADRLRKARSDASVHRLGVLLSYFTRRAPTPGQQALCAATTWLRHHVVTGQQPTADEHLGALLTWIDPPSGLAIHEAAEAARLVPMGLHTEPTFDRALLFPLLVAYEKQRGSTGSKQALADEIEAFLLPIAEPIYHATARAARWLEAVSPLPDLDRLERIEAEAFARYMDFCDQGFAPSGVLSDRQAVYAYAMRQAMEDNVAAAAILGDSVERARQAHAGRVIVGTVLPSPDTSIVIVETGQDLLRVRPGDTLYDAADTRRRLVVEALSLPTGLPDAGAASRITLRLQRGMRRPGPPAPGDTVTLVPNVADWSRTPRLVGQIKRRLLAAEQPRTPTARPSP